MEGGDVVGPEQEQNQQMAAAVQAGWNPADGEPPFEHTLAPDDALVEQLDATQ
jgi:hypothetical protein